MGVCRSFIGSSREDNSSEEKHQLKSFDDNEDENEEERQDIQLPSRHKTSEDDKERTVAGRLQQTGGAVFKQDEKIEIEAEKTQRLIYRITEAPPPHLTLFFALQVRAAFPTPCVHCTHSTGFDLLWPFIKYFILSSDTMLKIKNLSREQTLVCLLVLFLVFS